MPFTTKLARRTIFFGILLPGLYFGTASATFIYRLHAENTSRVNIRLPKMERPTESKRIVVFAPHCDDETLGCGGLIQQAVKAGAEVKVVMLTNGDGFRVAVERQMRSLQVEPKDYVQFASVRQQESYKALSDLGVPNEDVFFLGYPDRGLMWLWTDFWSAKRPYTSAYTKAYASPYRVAFRRGAPYCGQNLLEDIESVLQRERPTDVFVTHPSDDHPDHCAASAFVSLALKQLKGPEQDWADKCELHYYLVHRGDWPAPQGVQKKDMLAPPGEMAALDTQWSTRPLTDQEVDRKEKSILDYPSQTAIMKRFLLSFARKSELFGQLDQVRAVKVHDGKIRVDGRTDDWKDISPVILDPVNDNLLRDFQAGGDIKAVYACRDSLNLYVRIDTYQPVSDKVGFKLSLRYFGEANRLTSGGFLSAELKPFDAVSPLGITTATSGNRLEAAIPLRQLGYCRSMALNIESTIAGLQIDRTGYRFIDL